MANQNEFIISLMNVEHAARELVAAKDGMPGDDLGAEASAVAWIALRKALAEAQAIEDGTR